MEDAQTEGRHPLRPQEPNEASFSDAEVSCTSHREAAPAIPQISEEQLSAVEIYRAGVAQYKEEKNEAALASFNHLGSMVLPESWMRKHYFYYTINVLAFRFKRYEEALPLCDQGILEFPDYRDVWYLKGIILVRLGLFRLALYALKRALKIDTENANTVYEIAKILHHYNRREMTVKLATKACDLGIKTNYLYEMLANNHFYLGRPHTCIAYVRLLEAVGTTSGYLSYLKESSETAVAIKDRLRREPHAVQVNHVGIGAASYVGSTLLGTLLGSLPGAAHGGETQELIWRWDQGAKAPIAIDFRADPLKSYSHCRICGPECPVLTPEFRMRLAADPIDFYNKLGRHLGASTLVTSDKFVVEYMGKDPLFRFQLIILYKPLESWVRSYARQEDYRVRTGLMESSERRSVEDWLNEWTQTYEGLLEMPIPGDRAVVVNWDRFVQAPHAHFERLLRLLKLRGDSSVFEDLNLGHFVGGNYSANLENVLKEKRVEFKHSDAPKLNEENEIRIRQHSAAVKLENKLSTLYSHAFSGILTSS